MVSDCSTWIIYPQLIFEAILGIGLWECNFCWKILKSVHNLSTEGIRYIERHTSIII